MKKIILSLVPVLFLICHSEAQVKDTAILDSNHIEKIRKMPMDTIHHKPPVNPVSPPDQKDPNEDEPIRIAPSGIKDE